MTPMKIAAALVVTAALSIGLVACGSGSGSNQSSPSVPKRHLFATRGVSLRVINRDEARTTVTICAVNVRCKDPATLGVDQSVDMAAGEVNGDIRYADGYTVKFDAVNPDVGAPYIELTPPPGPAYAGQGPQTLKLSEGEWALTPPGELGGYRSKGERAADTSDYKIMKLTAYANGANAPCSYPNTLYPNSLPSSAC
jgi:hypothetical protein